MKCDDENSLLKGILSDEKLDALRQTSLDAGLGAMRRQRRRTRAVRIAGPAGMLTVLAWVTAVMLKGPSGESSPTPIVSVSPAPSQIKFLSDEELFALFPDRPAALIGEAGRQKFVLLDDLARR